MVKKILSICIVPYVIWLIFSYQYHFIDGANLLFHEAGHVILSIFGETIHYLGGSIGQLVFPILFCVSFFRRGHVFESAVCGIWLGENVINIAWYIGDAQAQAIPLVGGGIHDWHWLLSRAGLLSNCKMIATIVHSFGAIILLFAVIVLFKARSDGNDGQE